MVLECCKCRFRTPGLKGMEKHFAETSHSVWTCFLPEGDESNTDSTSRGTLICIDTVEPPLPGQTKYYCHICGYETAVRDRLRVHKATRKHLRNVAELEAELKEEEVGLDNMEVGKLKLKAKVKIKPKINIRAKEVKVLDEHVKQVSSN